MSDDIEIIRDGDSYRLLHGQLHLITELSLHDEVFVNVHGEGPVKVVRTEHGFFAGPDHHRLPVRRM